MSQSRTIGQIDLAERREILMQLEVRKTRDVAEEYGLSNNTIQHIRFYHHPKSSAPKRGYYHKDLLGDYVSPTTTKIKELKALGESSSAVAEKLDIPLEQVNKIWPTI